MLNLFKWLFAIHLLAIGQISYSQAYKISAQYSFGGEEDDNAHDLIQASDGGFIMVGSTNSKNSFDVKDSKAYSGNGGSDFLIIKTKVDGSLDWSKTFGGTRDEEATSIAKTINGEYVIVGPTRSTDGDAAFNGPNGGILMIRLKENGSFVSKKIIPGGRHFTQDTYHYSNAFSKPIVKVATSGNIYIGGTHEIALSPYRAKQFYLSKLTPTGDTLWGKVFGSDLDDQLGNFTIATNGDIVMVGSTTALKSQIDGAGNGNLDFLAIRVNSDGEFIWQKAWGGNNLDVVHGIIENHQKNGFVLAGETNSTNGIVNSSFGRKDAFLFEINSLGNLVWQNHFGGDGNDNLYNIIKDGNDKYLAFGTSDSKIQNVPSKGSITDLLTLTITKDGNIKNIGLYGGEDVDIAKGGVSVSDTSWVLAGISRSSAEDLTKNNGENDFWLIKFGLPPKVEFTTFKGYKNQQNQVELNWKTKYEIGAISLQLEKSLNNNKFESLKVFPIDKNSEEVKTYSFTDVLLRYGENNYRLTYIDENGKKFIGPNLIIDYSPLSIFNLPKEESHLNLYPNPANDRISINSLEPLAQISIHDLQGRTLYFKSEFTPNVGWDVNVASLKSGSYLIKVTESRKITSKRFIKN